MARKRTNLTSAPLLRMIDTSTFCPMGTFDGTTRTRNLLIAVTTTMGFVTCTTESPHSLLAFNAIEYSLLLSYACGKFTTLSVWWNGEKYERRREKARRAARYVMRTFRAERATALPLHRHCVGTHRHCIGTILPRIVPQTTAALIFARSARHSG